MGRFATSIRPRPSSRASSTGLTHMPAHVVGVTNAAERPGFKFDRAGAPGMLQGSGMLRLAEIDLAEWEMQVPAQVMNAGEFEIKPLDSGADLSIVDLKRQETITNAWMRSKSGWTPYDGVSVTGWPVGTIVRGRRVMWEGEIAAPAAGQPVCFLEQSRS